VAESLTAAARISRADRRRLLDRLDELADLEALMRERGTLARPGPPRATPSTTRKDNADDRDTPRDR